MVGVVARMNLLEPLAVIGDKSRIAHPAAFIQFHALITVRIALRVEMLFADGVGVIARFVHQARQLNRIAFGDLLVAEHAMTPWRLAGQNRGARGGAGRRGTVGPAEARAFSSETIQIWAVHRRISRASEEVGAHLVSHNENDVWLGGAGPILGVDSGVVTGRSRILAQKRGREQSEEQKQGADAHEVEHTC